MGRLLRPAAEAADEERADSVFRDVPPVVPVFDFSYDGVLRSLDESLHRMGRDRVDIVHVHDPDDHWAAASDGAHRALVQLRDEGTIGAVGAGMNQTAMLARLVDEVGLDCVLVAGRYSLLDQSALARLLPLCAERGVGVIVGGVFNSGLLADPRPGATYDYAPAPGALIDRARRLAAVCAEHGTPLRAAALQFPLGHPAVAAVLVGPRSPAEVSDACAMFRRPIPGALWDAMRDEGLVAAEAPVP